MSKFLKECKTRRYPRAVHNGPNHNDWLDDEGNDQSQLRLVTDSFAPRLVPGLAVPFAGSRAHRAVVCHRVSRIIVNVLKPALVSALSSEGRAMSFSQWRGSKLVPQFC